MTVSPLSGFFRFVETEKQGFGLLQEQGLELYLHFDVIASVWMWGSTCWTPVGEGTLWNHSALQIMLGCPWWWTLEHPLPLACGDNFCISCSVQRLHTCWNQSYLALRFDENSQKTTLEEPHLNSQTLSCLLHPNMLMCSQRWTITTTPCRTNNNRVTKKVINSSFL